MHQCSNMLFKQIRDLHQYHRINNTINKKQKQKNTEKIEFRYSQSSSQFIFVLKKRKSPEGKIDLRTARHCSGQQKMSNAVLYVRKCSFSNLFTRKTGFDRNSKSSICLDCIF